MKIETIDIRNYAGARSVMASPPGPLLLIGGSNGAGKTSTIQALRHALTGDPQRVRLKRELGAIVHDGARTGKAHVVYTRDGERGSRKVEVPTGSVEGATLGLRAGACYLRPGTFATLTPAERREAILEAAGTSVSPESLKKALEKKGVSAPTISKIASLLQNTEAAAEEAARMARELKGQWAGVTGEKWGAVKAESWAAEGDAPGLDVAEVSAKLERAEAAHVAAVQGKTRLETLDSVAKRAAADRELLENEIGPRIRALESEITHDRRVIPEIEARIETLRQRSGAKPRPEAMACPHCSGLVQFTDGKLCEFEGGIEVAFDASAAEALPAEEAKLDKARRELASNEAEVQKLRAKVEAIKAREVATPPTPEELEEAAQALTIAEECLHKVRAEANAVKAASEAKIKTERARKIDGEVREWLRVAELLQPEGLVSELSGPALDAFSGLLTETSARFDFGPVRVGTDAECAITVGGRPLALCSESEQWRANAVIAIALSSISGARLVLLDRLDVLEPSIRVEWLLGLLAVCDDDVLDQVIVAATLKEPPAKLPPGASLLWIEQGSGELQGELYHAA